MNNQGRYQPGLRNNRAGGNFYRNPNNNNQQRAQNYQQQQWFRRNSSGPGSSSAQAQAHVDSRYISCFFVKFLSFLFLFLNYV